MSLKSTFGMFGAYLAMSAADFVSSIGGIETNPFARYPDGAFWPHRALINMGCNTLGVACLSAVAYQLGKTIDHRWASFCAGLPWLYFGWDHLHAAVFNFQIMAGLAQ